jgi:branched-subunit amino acid transport protein
VIDDATFWLVTLVLGLGTFLIRFSFLGLLGGRQLPDWALTHLRYVGVAVLPALLTPMVIWAIVAGMGTLWLLGAVTG